jgi:dienelactone hydrolase
LLAARGFLCVSLDLPCHGKDNREKFANPLAGWRTRMENGQALIPEFAKKCANVLDYLIAEGYTDPKRIAACGMSRGGFIALHVTARDPRIRCAVAFAPVTNLLALGEYRGMEHSDLVNSLSLANSADKFVGRPIWICIGNQDHRVGTDEAIAFTRAVVKATSTPGMRALIELHVTPSHLPDPKSSPKEAAARLAKGHSFSTPQQEAVTWLLAQM